MRVSKNIALILYGLLVSFGFLLATGTPAWSVEAQEEIPSLLENTAPSAFEPIEVAQLSPGRVQIYEGEADRPKESKLQFSENKLKQSGFIVPASSPVGTIIKNFSNYNMFSIGEIVYVDIGAERGAKKGDMFTIFSKGRPVLHPVLKGSKKIGISNYERPLAQPSPIYNTLAGKLVGHLVDPLGTLEIIESQQGSSKAIVREAYAGINNGDYITPYEKPNTPPRLPNAKGDENLEGYVVAYLLEHSMGGLNDIVYIDRGSNDNVKPGDRFEVFVTPVTKEEHWNQFKEMPETPMIPHVVAELQVLDTRKETATGIVISSYHAIPLGASIRYKPVDIISPPLVNVAALQEAPTYQTADKEFPLEFPSDESPSEEPFAGFDQDVIEQQNEETQNQLMAFVPTNEMKDVHFSFDKADLDEVSQQIMMQNLDYLKRHPNVHTQIQGHCDERGTNNYNLALGERRANAIKIFLQTQGIEEHRLHLISYGEENPACHQSEESCWRQNRRVHFMVSGQDLPVN